MIMALTRMLDKNAKSNNLKSNNKSNGQNRLNVETDGDKSGSKPKKKLRNTPEQKKIAPQDGEPKEKEIDGRKYYWCPKCCKGEGMWAMHKIHNNNFKPGKQDNNGTLEGSNGQSKSTLKKVSFASVEDNEENSD